MKVRLRATFDEVWWVNGIEDHFSELGYTDPNNPWGGLDCIPNDRNAPPWRPESEADLDVRSADWDAYLEAEGVDTVTFDTLWDAAEFVLDFPGGVWDYNEGEAQQQIDTGRYRSVTLHVQDHQAAVFELADTIAKLRANLNRPFAHF